MRNQIALWFSSARGFVRQHHDSVMERISPVLSPFYWLGLLLSLFFCVYWVRYLPSAGIAIGALGAVGVFVALKGEAIQKGHRVIWRSLQ